MKHFLTAFCLVFALLLIQQESFAQLNHGLTVRGLWYNYETPEPDWDNWNDIFKSNGKGVELAYLRRFDKHTALVVPLKVGTAKKPSSRNDGVPGGNELLINLDLHLQYNLLKQGKLFNPYLLAGVGSTWNVDDEHFDFNIPAGLGLDVRLAQNLYANAQTQYRFSIEDRPGWHHGIGLTFYLGDTDSDEDGVLDKQDKCPDVAGLAALMGCPDRDGDGVADMDDKCPDLKGVVSLMGCPDRDSDGITDADDACPDIAGLPAFKGCPDRDNDGITDAEDECPEQAGIAAFKGCPDTDADGIPDKNDKCPTLAGSPARQGCPDRDGDGVIDSDDACPDQAGLATFRGCPDRDNDGVPDKDDRCPDKAGTVANRGCPEVTPEAKATLERAVRLVQFQTGKATLLASSYPVLDEVVKLMNTYSEYNLTISGHTDNTGNDKSNQTLSENRAKSCYDYLVSKGVNAARMKYAGYGESKPKADNKTKAGREQNRRVEFDLNVD